MIRGWQSTIGHKAPDAPKDYGGGEYNKAFVCTCQFCNPHGYWTRRQRLALELKAAVKRMNYLHRIRHLKRVRRQAIKPDWKGEA